MPTEPMERLVWIVAVILGPVVLVLIELFHPAGFTDDPGMFQYLSQAEEHTSDHHALEYFGPDWWFLLHMIQTPLVVLLAIGLAWTAKYEAERMGSVTAASLLSWLARLSLFIFAVYYTVLDAIGGIGLGRMLALTVEFTHTDSFLYAGQNIQCTDAGGEPTVCLTADQVVGVERVLNAAWTDPWVGGVSSFVSLLGSWAIIVSAVLIAAIVLIARTPKGLGVLGWFGLFALVTGSWYVQKSHACCTGPIGFGLISIFGLFTLLQDIRQRKSADTVL